MVATPASAERPHAPQASCSVGAQRGEPKRARQLMPMAIPTVMVCKVVEPLVERAVVLGGADTAACSRSGRTPGAASSRSVWSRIHRAVTALPAVALNGLHRTIDE